MGGSGFSLVPGVNFTGELWPGATEPPVCRFLGLGARGGGPEGLRTLIVGGADAEGVGGGMFGRIEDGFAYGRS